jgi:CRP/FNR family transcriptional regulator
MDKQLLAFLDRFGSPHTYPAGSMIFRQGDSEDCMYFVREGMALISVVTPGGRERNVLVSWPEHFSGLATFFEGGPHRSSAVALVDCQVVVIHREAFTRCCAEFPEVWGLIAYELSREVGLLIQETVDSALLSAEERVARFFVRRYAEGRYTATEHGLVMEFTQTVIAQVVGLSRWAVNQAMGEMKNKGWLTTQYGKIVILDMDALLKFSTEIM